MIERGDYWVWSVNDDNELEDPDTVGKWIIVAPMRIIKNAFQSINELVETGEIYKAKYPHQQHPEYDWDRYPLPVLCVYADNTTKDRTLELLKDLGLETDEWRYDSNS